MATLTVEQTEALMEQMKEERRLRERAWADQNSRCHCKHPAVMCYMKHKVCRRCRGWCE